MIKQWEKSKNCNKEGKRKHFKRFLLHLVANWASVWANQTCAVSAQNSGSLRATACTLCLSEAESEAGAEAEGKDEHVVGGIVH